MRGAAAAQSIGWPDLFERWISDNSRLTDHTGTLDQYAFQLKKLTDWAHENGIASPGALSGAQARAWAAERAKTKATAGRDVKLFRRVWRDLRIGDAWNGIEAGRSSDGERYRRLSVEEVRKLVAALRKGDKTEKSPDGRFVKGMAKPVPDVADLVAVGYHTGLRLKDAVQLTTEHIDGNYLRIIPAKTARRKGRALLVPLQPEARKLVDRLAEAAGDGGHLFPRLHGASLGKCLRLGFERAGVGSNRFGHASFHSLRATFISMMDEAGIPPHVTDAITGHAKAGMHGRYTQPGRDALMDAVCKAITPLGLL